MKKVIIGHRGVGKTEFLKRHASYLDETGTLVRHFDLDHEIETQLATTIEEIFSKKGESYFRQQESIIFKKLIDENKDFVISLGAGFDLSQIAKNIEIIFISRSSDSDGRIFLNRPRLNSQISSLEEFQERFSQRQSNYLEKASSIYFMPEGICASDSVEKKIINHQFEIKDAHYTLSASEIQNINLLKKTYKKIELRSDLISEKNIFEIVHADPQFDWLVSVRDENPAFEKLIFRL